MKKFVTPTVALIVACGEASSLPEEPAPVRGDPVEVPSIPGAFTGHPPIEGLELDAKGPRRLSVTQLERSLDVVAELPVGSIQLPENLALTLGEPDYQTTTQRSSDPTPLFMKFSIDFAAFVCRAIIDGDRQRPEGQRILARFDSAEENARFVWYRFTGIEGPAADESVARLVDAMNAAGSVPTDRALALCISAATSPEFLTY